MRLWLAALLSVASVFSASAVAADVRDLETKLKSRDPDVRRAAAKDLAELGSEARSAVPTPTVAPSPTWRRSG